MRAVLALSTSDRLFAATRSPTPLVGVCQSAVLGPVAVGTCPAVGVPVIVTPTGLIDCDGVSSERSTVGAIDDGSEML